MMKPCWPSNETNCRLLVYAPESGSPETLKIIKKKLKLDRLTESARKAVKIGHTVKINMIIGFPHEGLRHVLSSLLYGVRMAWHGVEDCNLAVFTPYPGSELYKQLRTADKIPAPSDDLFSKFACSIRFDQSHLSYAACFRPSARLLARHWPRWFLSHRISLPSAAAHSTV
jgi:radical SAM superfamily enzyme YgiQ (UPF0313 family)